MNDISSEVTEGAGDWLDRITPDSPVQERRAFVAWLLRSPTHVEEFLHLTVLRAELKGAMHPEWVARVLRDVETNVVEIPTPVAPSVASGQDRAPRVSAMAAALAAVCLAGWLGWQMSGPVPADPASLETTVGEQRFVMLSDGSSINLNTDSHVRISMVPTAREVELLRGEVLVSVVEDPARPFRIKSGAVTVEAIGTRFTVYRRNEDTRVAVVEGRVAVKRSQSFTGTNLTPAALTGLPMELSAGHQVALADGIEFKPSKADLKTVTAWTEQRVVFENETLEIVVAEFNRYNLTRLLIGDPVLTNRRITGRYAVNDSDELIKVPDALEPIRSEVTEDGHRVLYRDLERSH